MGNVSFKCPLPNVASLRFDTESLWLVYAGQKAAFRVEEAAVTAYDSDGTLFDPEDTEIHMTPTGEQVETVNDNGPGIVYSAGWSYAGNRGFGDYQNDVHYATGNGASVTFTFTGTGVRFYSETNADEGEIAVTLDGAEVGAVSGYAESRGAQQTLYEITGLPRGQHVLTLTKRSGEYMLVDAFGVLNG